MNDTSDNDSELRAWVAFARAGLTRAEAVEAVAAQGSAAAALQWAQRVSRGGDSPWQRVAGIDGSDLDTDLRWLDVDGRRLVAATHADYPAHLAELADAPAALYVLGDVAALHLPQLAIVGSRHPTPTGREIAYDFAKELAGSGLAITSGLAAGIDAAAHRGAIAGGGRTIAVCGTGLDSVYPADHAELAARIAARGALVSEYPPGTPPLKGNFPRRNRIISGLALGVLVVEAAQRSGSLITARLAGEQGRAVLAIPGSIHNPLARGCHRLIRDGARLVETTADIVAELNFDTLLAPAASRPQATDDATKSRRSLDSDYKMLLNALQHEPVDVDTLVERTGLKAAAVSSMLLILELEGEVESLAGSRYCRVPPRRAS